MGEQVASLLLRRSLLLFLRDAGQQLVQDDGGALVDIAQVLAGLGLLGSRSSDLAVFCDRFETPGLQPVAQLGRREAVVRVVGEDLVELPLIARVEPFLVGDDAGRGIDDLGGALAFAVERFQLLEGIGLGPDLDGLPDHAIQVDQDAPAQQPVDLLLARRVGA